MEEALAAKFGLGADLMFNDFAENGLCFTVGESESGWLDGWTSGITNARFNLVLGILVAILFIYKDAIVMLEADYWGTQQLITQMRPLIQISCRQTSALKQVDYVRSHANAFCGTGPLTLSRGWWSFIVLYCIFYVIFFALLLVAMAASIVVNCQTW